jgi:predicted ATPase
VAAEPAQEDAHVALMRLYALAGQRAQALAQYEQLTAILDRELDVEPDDATQDLAAAIRAGRYPDVAQPLVPEVVPPAPSTQPTPTNLPAIVSDLVGREREIAEVRQLLSTGRLVTLTGPGGVGKTRLGIEVAQRLMDEYRDGVWLFDLAPLSDPELVLSTIATTLAVPIAGQQPVLDALVASIRETRQLLLVDNVEHVVAAAPSLAALLTACPRLTILATSRVPLRVQGERRYEVVPLALPDLAGGEDVAALRQSEAVALFEQRARAVKADFRLTPENAESVAVICQRLDGLPLAIELAAARIQVLPPRALLLRLDRRLPLLTAGARDLPRRQQTLRNAIQWSYDLLAPERQHLFRALCIFRGGWTLDAAEAVAGQGAHASVLDTLGGLEALIEHSLVRVEEQPDGTARYAMLETIREFGLERLEAQSETDAAWERHTRFHLALVEEAEPRLTGREQEPWLARLATEHDNLRAALAWSAAHDADIALRLAGILWKFWLHRGHLREGADWLSAVLALDAVGVSTSSVRGKALYGTGVLVRELGDLAQAQALLEASLSLALARADRRGVASAMEALGNVAFDRGDLEAARRQYEQSLGLWQTLGDTAEIANVLHNLGLVAWRRRQHDTARALYEQSLTLMQATPDTALHAVLLNSLGNLAIDQGDALAAQAHYQQGLALIGDGGEHPILGEYLEGLAVVASLWGQREREVQLYGAVESMRERSGVARSPVDQPVFDRFMSEARAHLGAALFEAAWARGRAMTREESIAYALEPDVRPNAAR